jgi:origin recognition complex subunit 1
MKIIQSRLEGVPGGIVEPDAIQFASRKVAAVSGDARRALDICRRAVELAEMEGLVNENLPVTPSKRTTKGQAVQRSTNLTSRVTIATIKRAINEATTSPLQQHLRGLPFSSKLILAAILARVRRTGLQESILGDILDEAKRIAKMAVGVDTLQFLFAGGILDVVDGKSQINPSRKHPRIGAMGAAAIELMEAGIIALEVRRGDRGGKIRLCIGEEDVKQAFKDEVETRGLGF